MVQNKSIGILVNARFPAKKLQSKENNCHDYGKWTHNGCPPTEGWFWSVNVCHARNQVVRMIGAHHVHCAQKAMLFPSVIKSITRVGLVHRSITQHWSWSITASSVRKNIVVCSKMRVILCNIKYFVGTTELQITWKKRMALRLIVQTLFY